MHRRLLGLLIVPGLATVVSLLTDEQLAGIADWLGVADIDTLAEIFPELVEITEEAHDGPS